MLATRTVDGIAADDARAAASCSTAAPRVATALSPYIGYAATAEIAKESVRTGRSIRELVLERGLLDAGAARRDPVGGGDDAPGHRGGGSA